MVAINPDLSPENSVAIAIAQVTAKPAFISVNVYVSNLSSSYVSGEVWLSVKKLTGEPFTKESGTVPFALYPGKSKYIYLKLSDSRIKPGDKIELTAYLHIGPNIAKAKRTISVPVNRCTDGELLDNSVIKKDVTSVVKKFTSPVKRAVLTIYKTGGKVLGVVEPKMSDYQKYAMWKSGFTVIGVKCPKDGLTYYFKVPAKLSIEYVEPDPENVRYKRYEVDPPEKSPYEFNTSGIVEDSTRQPKEPATKDAEIPSKNSTPYLALISGIIVGVLLLVFLRR